MSQFPINTPEGVYEAVNYLASGPAASGQIYNGFNAYAPDPYNSSKIQYLTGNFRIPFSQVGVANLYVPAINLSGAQQLDNRTIKYTFSSAQASPPFALGNGLRITGISPSAFNSSDLSSAGNGITQIGVIECTTTYFIVRTVTPIIGSLGTYSSGGAVSNFISADYNNSSYVSTDCDIRINVNANVDKVAVNAQLNQTISYNVISGPSTFRVWVAIRRFIGTPNNDPVNPEYIFEVDRRYGDGILTQKIYTYSSLTGTGTIDLETIFQTALDSPGAGFYRYIVEVVYEYPDTGGVDVEVTQVALGLRSITVQTGK